MKKTTLYPIIFVVVTIALTGALTYYLVREIKTNSNAVVKQRKKLATLESERENLAELRQEYQRLKSELKRIDQIFVNPKAPVGFMEFLEQIANNSNFPINKSSSSGFQREEEVWPPLFYNITGVGSFAEFSQFLQKLENAPYLIKIQNMTIDRLEEEEIHSEEMKEAKPGDVKATLLIKVYSRKE